MSGCELSTQKNGNGGWSSFPGSKESKNRFPIACRRSIRRRRRCGYVTGRMCCTSSMTVPRAQLSPEEQINYDVYRPEIENFVADQKFRDYEMPANSDSAFWTDFGYTARRPFKTLTDYKNWIAQMRDIPRYFREQIANMRAGFARSFTPPRFTLQGREKSIATNCGGQTRRQSALHTVPRADGGSSAVRPGQAQVGSRKGDS